MPVSGVVPHVGGEVAVDVGVGEVRREAQAEDEASEDAEPASGLASDEARARFPHISFFLSSDTCISECTRVQKADCKCKMQQ